MARPRSLALLVLITTLAMELPASRPASAGDATPPSQANLVTFQYGQIGPATPVDLATLPPASSARASQPPPRLEPDPAAFALAKQQADAGVVPQNPPVATLPRPLARAAAASGTPSDVLVAFPGMSHELQMQPPLCTPGVACDQNLVPPDTQIAAGPSYVVEMVNASASVWTRTGTLVTEFDLNIYPFNVPPTYSLADPRILYDAFSGRWFASGVAIGPDSSSVVYLAVSASSDPRGGWSRYTVQSNTSRITYDQPKFGVSTDKVVISWDDYPYGNAANFTGEETWILNKADLLASPGSVVNSAWIPAPDPFRRKVVPSQPLSPTTSEYLTYNKAAPSLSGNTTSQTIGLVAITGTPPGTVTWSERYPPVHGTSVPPHAAQAPNGPLLDTGDDAFLSAVWQDNVLWTAGNDNCFPPGDGVNRSCLRLIGVSTAEANPMVLQDFDVGIAGTYLFYPAVTVDSSGNLFVAYTISAADQYASAAWAGLFVGPNVLLRNSIIESGVGVYGGNQTPERWGDYSAAARDPVDPTRVWLAAEYAAAPTATDLYNWGTGIGEVRLPRTYLPLVGGGG